MERRVRLSPSLRAMSLLSAYMAVVVCLFYLPSASAMTMEFDALDAESIALRSMSVAETMKSSGYCYAGVSKALAPLGVSLTGNAAYQARDLLIADSRFVPIATDENTDLQRGDIIVYNKSTGHPYGHICVYQGNNQESSDHVSSLTSPSAYGGVTVFRLRTENNNFAIGERPNWNFQMPTSAPDYRNATSLSPQTALANASPSPGDVRLPMLSPRPPVVNPKRNPNYGRGDSSSPDSKNAAEFVKREFRRFKNSPDGKSFKTRLIRFVINSL